MFKLISTFLLSFALTACATTGQEDNQIDSQFEQVNSNLAKLESSLGEQITSACQQDNETLVAQLTEALAARESASAKGARQADKQASAACRENTKTRAADEKLVIGAVEQIRLIKEEVTIDARIDTGAESSSLGVYRVGRFERDGKKWVKFSLSPDENAQLYRYPVYDTTRIKQESDEKAERRLEIKLSISMGGKKFRKTVFNLADRSHLDFQALVGRNFLRDIAVVDVSQSHLQGGK